MAIFDIRDYMNKASNASESKLVEDMYEEEIDITDPINLDDEEDWNPDSEEFTSEVEFEPIVDEDLIGQAEHDYGYEDKRPKRYNIDAYDYKGRAEHGRSDNRIVNNQGDNPMRTEELGDDDYDLERLAQLSGVPYGGDDDYMDHEEAPHIDLHDSDENSEEAITEDDIDSLEESLMCEYKASIK